MPVAPLCKKSMLIRRVATVKGEITYRMQCSPRFNYAKSTHTSKMNQDAILFISEGDDEVRLKLTATVPLKLKQGDGYAEFTLKTGESADFILESMEADAISATSSQEFVEKAYIDTLEYWKKWAAKCTYTGRWQEMVIRSALVLKLLISHEYGSIVAAATFSLPEKIGGKKNWDYRFTWIRDAAFTVYSLMQIGYIDEAKAFNEWVQKIYGNLGDHASLSPLYGFDGEKQLEETELIELEGYKGSTPVRIGNAAKTQLQLDIYGELIDSLYIYDRYVTPISHATWLNVSKQIEWVLKHWKDKDSGIWESRGKPMEFLHSRFMCWVAVDRAIKIGARGSLPFPETWIQTRDEIYESIYTSFWNEKTQSFAQYKKGSVVDASVLLMPLRRFIGPKDPQWLSTLKRVGEELTTDCLVYRYETKEDKMFNLKEGEGTFSACSFWYIECLSKSGQLQEAEFHFDKMLSYANHLGLYAEQLGFQGEHLGNFPQAFTHLALISAAYDLNKRLSNGSHQEP